MEFLLINKPENWTSFDVVAFIRHRAKQERQHTHTISRPSEINEINGQTIHSKPARIKVGHAGTLDPFATGLLIIGIGREATKRLDEFKKMPKTYIATIKLGETSDTYDKTGNITTCHSEKALTTEKNLSQSTNGQKIFLDSAGQNSSHFVIPSIAEIKQILDSFKGKQLQVPPMFSAKKINGQRLYTLARKGVEIERKPNEIEIYKIKLLEYTWPILKIEIQCSAGTYIRTLAHDIGAKLKVGAYCQELVRTQIGPYLLTNAININTYYVREN